MVGVGKSSGPASICQVFRNPKLSKQTLHYVLGEGTEDNITHFVNKDIGFRWLCEVKIPQ